MSDIRTRVPRAAMGAEERRARARLAQRVGRDGLLRGSVLTRRRVCGKATCKCTRGDLHESLYLVVSEGGRPRQLYVPRRWEAAVRRWVANYQRVKALLETVSGVYWDKVRRRQD